MTQAVYEYSGPGFSPLGDKGRFVLPAKFRKTLKDSNGGEKRLFLDKHPYFPCLIGFGEPYKAVLATEAASAAQTPEERYMLELQLNSFDEAPFDESGRFVMPRHMLELVGIVNAAYFNGAGQYFTIWNPETLLGMEGRAFVAAQAHCRSQLATAKARKG